MEAPPQVVDPICLKCGKPLRPGATRCAACGFSPKDRGRRSIADLTAKQLMLFFLVGPLTLLLIATIVFSLLPPSR